MFILTKEEMKELESFAIDDCKIPSILLMEHAGIKVSDFIKEKYDQKTNIIVFCGVGNNGGDGFVIARNLLLEGYNVKIILLTNESRIKGDSLTNYGILKTFKDVVVTIETLDRFVKYSDQIKYSNLIVDAIFGTGLNSDINALEEYIIKYINRSSADVISVDLPTGINANTAQVMKIAVEADYTITFDSPKYGNILFPGADYNGKLIVSNIGIPKRDVSEFDFDTKLITNDLLENILPKRSQNSHKGSFGKACVVAGSYGMAGAAILVCSTLMKSGVGLTKLFIPKSLNTIIKTDVYEIITVPLEEMKEGVYNFESIDTILKGVQLSDVVAIGPGCGNYITIKDTVRRLITESSVPLVIDADGLNILSDNISWLNDATCDIIITPHVKEMSRLTGIDIEEIIKEPVNTARDFAKKWGLTIVLKSARTVIATKTGKVYINIKGNSGMATAGSGDVLTGLITSLIAQGVSIVDAAILGVSTHAMAGDNVAEKIGEYGLTARDLMKEIPIVLNGIKKSREV